MVSRKSRGSEVGGRQSAYSIRSKKGNARPSLAPPPPERAERTNKTETSKMRPVSSAIEDNEVSKEYTHTGILSQNEMGKSEMKRPGKNPTQGGCCSDGGCTIF